MTRTEYGIQYRHEDGDWQFSLAGDAEQMGTPAGALKALDRARGMFPGDVWRIVYRTIPAWATAHEAALREDAAAEGSHLTVALARLQRPHEVTKVLVWHETTEIDAP